jgi:uncharacterized repeat protein (TIGR03803 family)
MKAYRSLHSSILNLSNWASIMLAVALGAVTVVVFAGSAAAGDRVIYNFQGGNDGIGSNDLIADRAGNLYGTTFNGGGPAGAGTVYELSPPAEQTS